MVRWLCMELIDFYSIEVLFVNWLILLDKGEGVVRLIGVGEVFWRIIGKCVMRVLKFDVIEVSGLF